jgi:hypothetical protein
LVVLTLLGCGSETPFPEKVTDLQHPSKQAAQQQAARPEVVMDRSHVVPDATQLSLADGASAWCPSGARLDTSHWLCVQGKEALGPFPPAMVESCIKAGGGEKACRGERWDAEFARKLRGTSACPPGTTLDTSISECTVGQDIFGPFSKELVERCLAATNGSTVCKSQRVHRSFASAQQSPSVPPKATAPQPGGRVLDVPYFYQYHNSYEPGRTCNITSVAMVAGYYGINVHPDQVYKRVGGPVFTGPDMIWVAGRYGLKGTFSSKANIATIKGHLDAGRPVIVQGWFTKSGHILVITGYDSKGWIVNDPAGQWARCYACGYPGRTSVNGKGTRYSYAAMEAAATDPGNPNSYWITVLTR